VPGQGFAAWSEQIASVISIRSEIYHLTVDALKRAVAACESASTAGTIAPLKLTFDTPKLVYPLGMTGLNRGETRVQLHVLADEEVAVGGMLQGPGAAFATPYSKRLEESDLDSSDSLRKFVGEGRDHLTRLTAALQPEQIAGDAWLVSGPAAGSGSVAVWHEPGQSLNWADDRLLWLASWLLVPIVLLGGLVLLRAAMRRRTH
jgi:hypothetical protein